MTCFFVAFFIFIQTVAGSGYYGIEYFTAYTQFKNSTFFSSLSVRSLNQSFYNNVVLGSLAICAQAHH